MPRDWGESWTPKTLLPPRNFPKDAQNDDEMLGRISPPVGIFEPAGSLRQVVMFFWRAL
jgi:hypothetical protein